MGSFICALFGTWNEGDAAVTKLLNICPVVTLHRTGRSPSSSSPVPQGHLNSLPNTMESHSILWRYGFMCHKANLGADIDSASRKSAMSSMFFPLSSTWTIPSHKRFPMGIRTSSRPVLSAWNGWTLLLQDSLRSLVHIPSIACV